MLRKHLVEERIVGGNHLSNRSLFANDVLKERYRFVMHRRLHFVGELREALGIHSAVLVKAIEAQPLPEELGRQPPRFRVRQHPPNLSLDLLRIA